MSVRGLQTASASVRFCSNPKSYSNAVLVWFGEIGVEWHYIAQLGRTWKCRAVVCDYPCQRVR